MKRISLRDDTTQLWIDAVVNVANTSLLGGGSVGGAIHRAREPAILRNANAYGRNKAAVTWESGDVRGFTGSRRKRQQKRNPLPER
ncbi:macro domain-containing protein [Parapedobacter sp. GCM10030251]|uniref:macro domain-containing protein n=1 Tax=Parapedobacter sp. GCM10030251 TaxID=3273419 RepID=UPI00360EBA77